MSTIDNIVSVQGFLSNLVDGFKDSQHFLDKLSAFSSYLGVAGTALKEGVPALKFIVEFVKAATQVNDPNELGNILCTTAYQQAVVEALTQQGISKVNKPDLQALKQQLSTSQLPERAFMSFELRNCLDHPFMRESNKCLGFLMDSLGLPDSDKNQIQQNVNRLFQVKLVTLLSHRDHRDKFDPWLRAVSQGNQAELLSNVLCEHIAYQRSLFREVPVLGVEPFPIARVYINVECGYNYWRDLRSSDPRARKHRGQTLDDSAKDPFSEKIGGRHDLLKTTLDLINDPNFKDAIVIQGVAGAGKSTFTLRLVEELDEQGFWPVRIRLRDLVLGDRPLSEAIRHAIRTSANGQHIWNPDRLDSNTFARSGPLFSGNTHGKAKVSLGVLIFDGWDEIQTGNEGIHHLIERYLRDIRNEYLQNDGRIPIRVVITGRPSIALHESKFLHDDTAVLTLRRLTPDALDDFAKRFQAERGDKTPDKLAAVTQAYREEFDESTRRLDVLEQPLLALLGIRSLLDTNRKQEELLANRTALYRELIDLTCTRAGQPSHDQALQQARLQEYPLRRLLREVATAITMNGSETIAGKELLRRLDILGVDLSREIDFDKHPKTVLIAAFFFHTDQLDLANEFTHKSFREYLFAEAIIEHLKEYGRTVDESKLLSLTVGFDFNENDPRWKTSRDLCLRLAAQWLTEEVRQHLFNLIDIEVRECEVIHIDDTLLKKTRPEPITKSQWCKVRTFLADLWKWWIDEAHVRPRITLERGKEEPTWHPSYAHELIEKSAPQLVKDKQIVGVPDTSTSIDARLGIGIFHLCVAVHLPLRSEQVDQSPHPYQRETDNILQFAPSGTEVNEYGLLIDFKYALTRMGSVKSPTYMVATNAPGICLAGAVLAGVNLDGANLSHANLAGAVLAGANLDGAHLDGVNLDGAHLVGANLVGANFTDAHLVGVDLSGANLMEANLVGVNLMEANLVGVNLRGADLMGANLARANLAGANLIGTIFGAANLVGANLTGANLTGADFGFATLTDAHLTGTNYTRAIFEGAIGLSPRRKARKKPAK